MFVKNALVGVASVALIAGGAVGAQPDPSIPQVHPDVARIVLTLRTMGDRLLLSLHLATMGVLAPTQLDQRLYAGQLLNYLVGPGADGFDARLGPEERFTGLLPEARSLTEFIAKADVPPEVRDRLSSVAKRVLLLLAMARDDARQALRARRLDIGADHLLRAFAYLHAALGRDTDPVHLGGVLALLRILPPVPPTDRSP
ncbi:hypothetical protein H5T55_06830 [Candidatus Bipolaricaulota bacterium]|nr:hypothetical protein [Candidatus Bipolaricaulota bacterium]